MIYEAICTSGTIKKTIQCDTAYVGMLEVDDNWHVKGKEKNNLKITVHAGDVEVRGFYPSHRNIGIRYAQIEIHTNEDYVGGCVYAQKYQRIKKKTNRKKKR